MLFDEDAVRAVLVLAGPSVDSEESAAEVFSRFARGRRTLNAAVEEARRRGTLTAAVEPRDGRKRESFFETEDWEKAQALVRRWLPKVAGFDELPTSTRVSFLNEFNDALYASGMGLKVGVRGLMAVPGRTLETIGGVVVRALIPFLIPNGWSPRRLGQCQLEECGQWFLRPEARRGSVPLYCSPRHASVAHVRAFRERQRQAKE